MNSPSPSQTSNIKDLGHSQIFRAKIALTPRYGQCSKGDLRPSRKALAVGPGKGRLGLFHAEGDLASGLALTVSSFPSAQGLHCLICEQAAYTR